MTAEKFIIIYDTYCGWCYGAAPMFDALVESGAEVEVLHRKLFCKPNTPKLSEGKGALIIEADAKIAALTGQPFSQNYIDNVVLSDKEILDSSFTAQAAALVHEQGALKEFSVRKRLEDNRYKHGISAQDRHSVINTLIDEGIAENDAHRVGTEALVAKSNVIAERASQLMSNTSTVGIPTILKTSGNTVEIINHSAYYDKPKDIKQLVYPALKDAG